MVALTYKKDFEGHDWGHLQFPDHCHNPSPYWLPCLCPQCRRNELDETILMASRQNQIIPYHPPKPIYVYFLVDKP